MIAAKNLKKIFGTFEAVSDVSFSALPGRILGLLGPNGAGKTSTIRMLTGYLSPSAGEVLIFDKVFSAADRSAIGYLPELPPIYPELRVSEVLNFWAKIKDVKDLKNRTDEVLEKCKLTEVRQKLSSQLSKGFKQRLGFAIALIADPKILILDEPTSGLDPVQISEMRKLILDLKQAGRTVILSSHVMQEISEICTDVVIMSKGKVVASGEIAEFTNSINDGTVGSKTLEASFLEAISR